MMKNIIPQEEVIKSEKNLNTLLADLNILYLTARNIHRNLVDGSFISLHKFFEEIYGDLAEKIDETAEHLRSLGLPAVAHFETYTGTATIDNIEKTIGNKDEALTTFVDQLTKILENLAEYIKASDNDPIRQDYYISTSAELEKTRWLVASHK